MWKQTTQLQSIEAENEPIVEADNMDPEEFIPYEELPEDQ
jgi:hypothetical protein